MAKEEEIEDKTQKVEDKVEEKAEKLETDDKEKVDEKAHQQSFDVQSRWRCVLALLWDFVEVPNCRNALCQCQRNLWRHSSFGESFV